jgi:hypothetical protein
MDAVLGGRRTAAGLEVGFRCPVRNAVCKTGLQEERVEKSTIGALIVAGATAIGAALQVVVLRAARERRTPKQKGEGGTEGEDAPWR